LKFRFWNLEFGAALSWTPLSLDSPEPAEGLKGRREFGIWRCPEPVEGNLEPVCRQAVLLIWNLFHKHTFSLQLQKNVHPQ
jgi:hypothetical protein